MSKLDEIRHAIETIGSGIWFDYDGRHCGIDTETIDGEDTFAVYYGDDVKEYDNLEDVFTDSFFGGKSIEEFIDDVDVDFC